MNHSDFCDSENVIYLAMRLKYFYSSVYLLGTISTRVIVAISTAEIILAIEVIERVYFTSVIVLIEKNIFPRHG